MKDKVFSFVTESVIRTTYLEIQPNPYRYKKRGVIPCTLTLGEILKGP
jgi:hypothetical protein